MGFSSTGVTSLASWSLHLCAYKWVAWAVLTADLRVYKALELRRKLKEGCVVSLLGSGSAW